VSDIPLILDAKRPKMLKKAKNAMLVQAGRGHRKDHWAVKHPKFIDALKARASRKEHSRGLQ